MNETDEMSTGMRKIQVEINKGLQIVLGITIMDHISVRELVETVGIPSANQLAVETTLMDMWRHINHNLPATENLKSVDDCDKEKRETRRTGKGLLVTLQRDNSGASRFSQQGSRLWNVAPQELRDERNEIRAKQIVRTFSRSFPL